MLLRDFVGIPYKVKGRDFDGVDCWGLCLLYSRVMLGIELPEYFYTMSGVLRYSAMHIELERGQAWWGKVEGSPEAGDIHILRVGGIDSHCGIAVSPHEMLHSLHGRNSCVERVDSIQWRDSLTGSYRYAG